QGEPQPLAFDEHGLLNPLTQQCNWSAVLGARANEEENTHSCLQIGGTMSVSQGLWFRSCDSGAVVQRVWWVNPTSTTRNDTFPGVWRKLQMEVSSCEPYCGDNDANKRR
ncbi:hypothetical protein Tco_1350588, partial [Tanacetum coccineum]